MLFRSFMQHRHRHRQSLLNRKIAHKHDLSGNPISKIVDQPEIRFATPAGSHGRTRRTPDLLASFTDRPPNRTWREFERRCVAGGAPQFSSLPSSGSITNFDCRLGWGNRAQCLATLTSTVTRSKLAHRMPHHPDLTSLLSFAVPPASLIMHCLPRPSLLSLLLHATISTLPTEA